MKIITNVIIINVISCCLHIRVPLAGIMTGKDGLLVTLPIRARVPPSPLMSPPIKHTELVSSIRKPLGEVNAGSSSSHGNKHPARHDPIRPLSQQKLRGRVGTGSARATPRLDHERKRESRCVGPETRGGRGGAALSCGLRVRAEAEAVSTSRPGPPPQLAETRLPPDSSSHDVGR